MKPRAQSEDVLGKVLPSSPTRVGPDPFDAGEQRFAASQDDAQLVTSASDAQKTPEPKKQRNTRAKMARPSEEASPGLGDFLQPPETSDWREEVAAKVSRYRSHKPPPVPRYPSLQFKFEAGPLEDPRPLAKQPAPTRNSLALEQKEMEAPVSQASANLPTVQPELVPLQGLPDLPRKIIEFPRVIQAHVSKEDELAGPVQDILRIIEAPELTPAPPALGGMLIEEQEEGPKRGRAALETPLQVAVMSQRAFGAAVDAAIVLCAVVLFGAIFYRMTWVKPPLLQTAAWLVGFSVAFWFLYEYLMLVYAGTTPGLTAAGLRLAKFDGSPLLKPTRRWRVLASLLSGASFGLGFAWCLLDEDQLCWHDRMTRTYVASRLTGGHSMNLFP